MRNLLKKEQYVGAIPIALIMIGIVITVPAFLVGSQIMRSLGLISGAISISIGSVIIALLASGTMYLASITHISTYEMSARSFGRYGSRIVSTVIGFTLLGWFAVTANLFGDAAAGLAQILGVPLGQSSLIVLGCVLVILTVVYGFKALERFSRVATPMLAILLGVGVILVLREYDSSALISAVPAKLPGMQTIGAAISILIGAFMVAVTIAPDYARFAKTSKDAVLAAWMAYGIGGALVLIGSGLPGLVMGSDDLIGSFSKIGLGVFAFILLLVATWTTNAGNLYSAQLANNQIIGGRIPPALQTIIIGVLGIAIALWFNLDKFGQFLQILAISIPPVAGIYLCDGFLFRQKFSNAPPKNWDMSAFASWVVAICIGLLATYGPLKFLSIPALATLICAFGFRWCLSTIFKEAK